MNIIILVAIVSIAIVGLAALIASTRSAVARFAASFLALCFAAFCAFGFLASFELSDAAALPWQLSYGALGIGSLATAVWLAVTGVTSARKQLT